MLKLTRLTLSAAVLLAGCAAPAPAPTLPAAVVSVQPQTLSRAQVDQLIATPEDADYTIGPGDVIAVSVYLHPELTTPPEASNSPLGGALVTGSGIVALPLLGPVQLGGLTLQQANAAVTQDYAAYLRDPKVALQVVQPQSLRYYLLGEFTSPGVKYPVRPLTLLEALALGGSVDIPRSDLYQAYVAHGAVKLPVDLHALLVEGDLSQNIPLTPGDSIVVPSAVSESAFVLGAVGKPGAVPFQSGGLSLLQALSAAGLDLPNYTEARLSQVHIIRSEGRGGALIVVDARKILNGQALPFALQPGDVVFVPPTGFASWNQTLNLLLPSLQTVAGVLDPFVSIKYLTR